MSEAAFLEMLHPGVLIYVSAGSAEPLALAPLLVRHADRMDGVEILGSFVPGVNATDYAALHPGARMTTLLLPAAARKSFEAGKVSILPLSYTGLAQHLENQPPDIAVVHMTPPDDRGLCSLGPAADFAPLVWKQARRRVAVINPSLPTAPGSWTVPFDEIDAIIECDHVPLGMAEGRITDVTHAVAEQAAALVDNGACLQTGIGGVPGAVLSLLTGRKNLTIHTGMITDGIANLRRAGALDPDGHSTGIAIGSPALYDWLAHADGFAFVPTPETHGPAALAARKGLIAINSALEVDLFGQVNLEWRTGKLVSGVGGAPDFAAGARLSEGGLAVIALPSTAKSISRITAHINAPTVSLARNTIDVIVTEHGTARIGAMPMEQRAQALIAIAAPEHRAQLQADWEKQRDNF